MEIHVGVTFLQSLLGLGTQTPLIILMQKHHSGLKSLWRGREWARRLGIGELAAGAVFPKVELVMKTWDSPFQPSILCFFPTCSTLPTHTYSHLPTNRKFLVPQGLWPEHVGNVLFYRWVDWGSAVKGISWEEWELGWEQEGGDIKKKRQRRI